MEKGVFQAKKKDGTIYFRASITRKGKHVALGSYATEEEAALAYRMAEFLYAHTEVDLLGLSGQYEPLSCDRAVTILNHRDHGIYIKTPIYLRRGYFSYFLKGVGELKFDNDDLFYYSSHRILVHDGHLYVNDFGMQYGILARYGIKNFAVSGRDYRFANGDSLDFRYENIIVINRYHGVTQKEQNGSLLYEVKIHINGDFLVGRYDDEAVAAVAYNKAADAAQKAGVAKEFPKNYVIEYAAAQYHRVYREIELPLKYQKYLLDLD